MAINAANNNPNAAGLVSPAIAMISALPQYSVEMFTYCGLMKITLEHANHRRQTMFGELAGQNQAQEQPETRHRLR